jgi:excisionase family DNA binding protein
MNDPDDTPNDRKPDPTPLPPLLVTVKEACRMLHLCRTSVYHLVTDGKLKAVRIGGAVRFRPEHLREFIDALSPDP